MFALSITLGMALVVTQPPADEGAIRSLLNARQAAWIKRDVAGLVKDFALDCDHVYSSGEVVRGSDDLRKRY